MLLYALSKFSNINSRQYPEIMNYINNALNADKSLFQYIKTKVTQNQYFKTITISIKPPKNGFEDDVFISHPELLILSHEHTL